MTAATVLSHVQLIGAIVILSAALAAVWWLLADIWLMASWLYCCRWRARAGGRKWLLLPRLYRQAGCGLVLRWGRGTWAL
jgi:hypothetical protein